MCTAYCTVCHLPAFLEPFFNPTKNANLQVEKREDVSQIPLFYCLHACGVSTRVRSKRTRRDSTASSNAFPASTVFEHRPTRLLSIRLPCPFLLSSTPTILLQTWDPSQSFRLRDRAGTTGEAIFPNISTDRSLAHHSEVSSSRICRYKSKQYTCMRLSVEPTFESPQHFRADPPLARLRLACHRDNRSKEVQDTVPEHRQTWCLRRTGWYRDRHALMVVMHACLIFFRVTCWKWNASCEWLSHNTAGVVSFILVCLLARSVPLLDTF